MRTDHTPDPSALILGVKFCDRETGTNLHTQERTKDLNARLSSPFLLFCHVLVGAFCHVLVHTPF